MEFFREIPWLEVFGAGFSIVYSLLLMREKMLGWLFGIAASIISMYLFFETKLYAQAVISIYYACVGVYGWMYWYKAKERNEHIHVWGIRQHVLYVGMFIILSLASTWVFKNYTDSASPYLDSFLTLFGLLASIKEARKILTSWVYWFVINGVSVYLYFSQHLYYYAAITVLYTIICIPGYLNWLKIYRNHEGREGIK